MEQTCLYSCFTRDLVAVSWVSQWVPIIPSTPPSHWTSSYLFTLSDICVQQKFLEVKADVLVLFARFLLFLSIFHNCFIVSRLFIEILSFYPSYFQMHSQWEAVKGSKAANCAVLIPCLHNGRKVISLPLGQN